MQIPTFPCAACGADAHLRSSASLIVVCQQCGSTHLKELDAFRDLGRMPPVLEDYSPIRIGSSGTEAQRPFIMAGRVRLRYPAGVGNEWYLVFEDGGAGWLGEFAGVFTLTAACAAEGSLPPLAGIHPGESYVISGAPYTAAEVRSGVCIGVQGELPFRIGDGWRVQAADLRSGDQFATLDYSDGPDPSLYVGREITLAALQLQHLRDDAQIKSSTGRFRARIETGKCPSCSAAVVYVPGMAAYRVCPGCQSQLDASGAEIQAKRTWRPVDSVKTGLKLGASAIMQGRRFTVIGLLRRATAQYGEWNEYLLFSLGGVFIWLVETEDGWAQAKPQPTWPVPASPRADSRR